MYGNSKDRCVRLFVCVSVFPSWKHEHTQLSFLFTKHVTMHINQHVVKQIQVSKSQPHECESAVGDRSSMSDAVV